ncbi:MAG: hypothetical protein AAGI45_07730 [Cyanobacteria bacterium P01_H01_bin.26]
MKSPWTPSQLLQMSRSLETAYGTGSIRRVKQASHWTQQQLLALSAAKSSIII